MSFTPYLLFAGTCRAAMTFYAEVFAADDLSFNNFDDGPPEMRTPDAAGLVMHAQFSTGPGRWLMASDMPASMGEARPGSVYWGGPDAAAAERVFNRLAEGAVIQIPFGATFWSPAFGGLRDRFGTDWMISLAVPEG